MFCKIGLDMKNIISIFLLLGFVSCSSKSVPKPKRSAPEGTMETATCLLGSKKMIQLMKPQDITIELESFLEENCESAVKSAVMKKKKDWAKYEQDNSHEVKPDRYWDYYACYMGTERVDKKFALELTPDDLIRVKRFMSSEINKNYIGEDWNGNFLRVREEVCKDAMVELSKTANGKESKQEQEN